MFRKMIQTYFLNRVLAPGTYLDRFLLKTVQIPLIRSRFRFFSTRFVQDSPFFLDFSRIFSIQISSGMSIPYRKPISATPGIILPYRNIPSSILHLFLPPLIRAVPARCWTNMGPTWIHVGPTWFQSVGRPAGHSRPASRPGGHSRPAGRS